MRTVNRDPGPTMRSFALICLSSVLAIPPYAPLNHGSLTGTVSDQTAAVAPVA